MNFAKIPTYFLIVLMTMQSCQSKTNHEPVAQVIADDKQQDSIFRSLEWATNHSIPQNLVNDSLAFLILPLEASCPSCRKKTIDSIVKHQESLQQNRFIILSASGGRKTMNSYFKEENASLPQIENNLFLDSTNHTNKLKLCTDKPTFYYTYSKKAYKKVESIPATVRGDLKDFFSGN